MMKSTQDTFAIYQVKEGSGTRDIRSMPLDELKAAGRSVKFENYDHVYTGTLEPEAPTRPTLRDIYRQFSTDHPEDFTGRSMSISDVVVIRQDGTLAAYYADSRYMDGFAEVHEFFGAPYLYHSTQRPIDIGTFPKFSNEPVNIENYGTPTYVESGSVKAWGTLTYTMPLTQKQISDYELRAASGNPDNTRQAPGQLEAQIQVIGKYEKAHRVPETRRLTWWYPDFGVFVKNDGVTHEKIAAHYRKIMEVKARTAQKKAEKGAQKMWVLLAEPNEYAREVEIERSLKAEQAAVGGRIAVIEAIDDPVVYIYNDDGKTQGLELNRAIYDRQGNVIDIIAGNFLVCGVNDGDFISLSPELMEKYKGLFLEPEIFTKQNGKFTAIKIPAPETEVKKSFAEQMREATEQAAEGNAARPQTDPTERSETDRG
jgi:hypothetical protein